MQRTFCSPPIYVLSIEIKHDNWLGVRGQEKLGNLVKQVEILYHLDQGQGSSGAYQPFINYLLC